MNSTYNNRIIAHHTNVNLESGFILKLRNYSECCFKLSWCHFENFLLVSIPQ